MHPLSVLIPRLLPSLSVIRMGTEKPYLKCLPNAFLLHICILKVVKDYEWRGLGMKLVHWQT